MKSIRNLLLSKYDKKQGVFFVKSIRYNTLGKKDHFFLISRKNLEVENCENKPISRKIDHFGSFGSFGSVIVE